MSLKTPLSAGHGAPPLAAWLDLMVTVMPPEGALLLGAGNGTGPLVRWLAQHDIPAVCLVEGDERQYQHLARAVAPRAGWTLRRDVLAPAEGPVAFHRTSNPAENSLVKPELLQALWPHLSAESGQAIDAATSLDTVAREQATPFNWLLIDCLPAAGLLSGAADMAPGIDVLVARVVSDTLVASGHGATVAELQDLLAGRGLQLAGLIPTRHPAIFHAVAVRDVAHQREEQQRHRADMQAALASAHAEVAAATQERTHIAQQHAQAIADLSNERGALQAALVQARDQQKQQQTAQEAADSERARLHALLEAVRAEAVQANEARMQALQSLELLTQERDALAQQVKEAPPAPPQQQQQPKEEPAPLPAAQPVFSVSFKLGTDASSELPFYAPPSAQIEVSQGEVRYVTDPERPIYIVSNDTASFDRTSGRVTIPAQGSITYVLEANLAVTGGATVVLWVFQYRQGEKLHAAPLRLDAAGRVHNTFTTAPGTDALALALRVSGTGGLSLAKCQLALHRQTEAELVTRFEQRLSEVEENHQREMGNALRQMEASIRLQHFLGPDVMLPKLHNWPISPDLGLWIVELFEQHAYTAAVEFGSGSSTLLLAHAMQRFSRPGKGAGARLLSFEHLEQYHRQTKELLRAAALESRVNLELAPLVEQGQEQLFYDCRPALADLGRAIQRRQGPVLVLVDGPPAATSPHARFPALPRVMEALGTQRPIHFLMDDFIRADEKAIVVRWEAWLTERNIPHRRTEQRQLEKQACLLEVNPAPLK